jgi:hypothetical protein
MSRRIQSRCRKANAYCSTRQDQDHVENFTLKVKKNCHTSAHEKGPVDSQNRCSIIPFPQCRAAGDPRQGAILPKKSKVVTVHSLLFLFAGGILFLPWSIQQLQRVMPMLASSAPQFLVVVGEHKSWMSIKQIKRFKIVFAKFMLCFGCTL